MFDWFRRIFDSRGGSSTYTGTREDEEMLMEIPRRGEMLPTEQGEPAMPDGQPETETAGTAPVVRVDSAAKARRRRNQVSGASPKGRAKLANRDAQIMSSTESTKTLAKRFKLSEERIRQIRKRGQ